MKDTARQQSSPVDYKKMARILWGNVSGVDNRRAAARGLVEYLKTTDLNFNAEEFTRVLITGR